MSISEIPTHVHSAQASLETTNNLVDPPANNILASPATQLYCSTITNLTSLLPSTLANVGGSQAHLNMQPFLTLSLCIALQGIFPSQT